MFIFASLIRKDRQTAILPHNFNSFTDMNIQSVINAFANNKVGCSSNGNLYSTSDKLINYNTCIAQRLQNGTIVVNSTKYSTSTSKLPNRIRYTIGKYKEVVNVPINTCDLERFVK